MHSDELEWQHFSSPSPDSESCRTEKVEHNQQSSPVRRLKCLVQQRWAQWAINGGNETFSCLSGPQRNLYWLKRPRSISNQILDFLGSVLVGADPSLSLIPAICQLSHWWWSLISWFTASFTFFTHYLLIVFITLYQFDSEKGGSYFRPGWFFNSNQRAAERAVFFCWISAVPVTKVQRFWAIWLFLKEDFFSSLLWF